MRSILAFIFCVTIVNTSLPAQNFKIILVRAGTSMTEYYPYNERFRYKEFMPGKVVFKNGASNNLRLNYFYLTGEVEFLQGNDTLYLSKKKDLSYFVATDTFYYDNGYIEQISGGQIKFGMKQYVRVKDILREGALGQLNRVSAIGTYNSLWADSKSFGLVPNENLEVQMTIEYYISDPSGGFIMFTRKNVLQLFPQRADDIKAYIKSQKVDFDSRDDLLKFADYLRGN